MFTLILSVYKQGNSGNFHKYHSTNYTQTFVVWSIKAASGLNWTLIIVSAEYLSIREKNVLN